MDLWALPIMEGRKAFPIVNTPFEDREGQFSPDGRWVAYQSNVSQRFEIYVQPFPGPGGTFLVSTNGGAQPRWRRDGKEIFYVALDGKHSLVRTILRHRKGWLQVLAGKPGSRQTDFRKMMGNDDRAIARKIIRAFMRFSNS